MTADPEILSPDADDEQVVTNSNLTKLEEADRAHMIATARKYPRVIEKFVKDLTSIACYSQPTAIEMMYSVPRAGKQLVGPSVRFAEAVLSCWGNCRAGMEVVDVDRQEGVVTAEGRFYDCEKNTGIAIRKRRRIVAKKIDADSIQVTGDAINSIVFRDAILRSVPKALWKPIWEKSKETAAGNAASIQQIRESLVGHFNRLGVTTVQVLNALEVQGVADIGADQIIALNAWKKQIAEGDSTLEDIFGFKEEAEAEAMMAKLGWNSAKVQMCKQNYKGRSADMLAYLRGEVEKLSRGTTQAQTGQPEGNIQAQQQKGRGRGSKLSGTEPSAKSEPAKDQPSDDSSASVDQPGPDADNDSGAAAGAASEPKTEPAKAGVNWGDL